MCLNLLACVSRGSMFFDTPLTYKMKKYEPYKNWKKPVAFVFALVFLFSSFGFTYYTHHCPLKGSSISFFSEVTCCCAQDGESDKGCCKNESGQIKIEDTYNVAKSLAFGIAGFIPTALLNEIHFTCTPAIVEERQLFESNNSPPQNPIAIFLFDRSILI